MGVIIAVACRNFAEILWNTTLFTRDLIQDRKENAWYIKKIQTKKKKQIQRKMLGFLLYIDIDDILYMYMSCVKTKRYCVRLFVCVLSHRGALLNWHDSLKCVQNIVDGMLTFVMFVGFNLVLCVFWIRCIIQFRE